MGLPGDTTTINPLDHHIECEGYNCECNALAVKKVQGETDSFGCEYLYLCHDCYTKLQTSIAENEGGEDCCDWCKKLAILSPIRDFEEGLNGPIYYVCSSCRNKQDADIWEEYEEYN